MDEFIIIIIMVLLGISIPLTILYLFVRLAPKLRYLPSVLLLIFGLICLMWSTSTKPTGGGMYGMDDVGIYVVMAIGAVVFLAAAITFFISWAMYKRKLRHDRKF